MASTPELLTPEEIAELRRLEMEETEDRGPTWIAEKLSDTSEGLEEWWIHTPFVEDSCSLVAREMWEDTATLVAAVRNALPRLLLAAERAEGLAGAAEGLLDHMHECGAGVDCMITTHQERAAITAARAALAAYRGSAGGGTT